MTVPQWKKHLLNPSAPITVNAISQTVELVFNVLMNEGPSGIDLYNLEPDKVNPEHLAAILRATSSWEHIVPGWKDALDVAHKALILNKMDPQDALYGLIPKLDV